MDADANLADSKFTQFADKFVNEVAGSTVVASDHDFDLTWVATAGRKFLADK